MKYQVGKRGKIALDFSLHENSLEKELREDCFHLTRGIRRFEPPSW